VTGSLSSFTPGQPVTFTATVSANAPGSGTPTGTVQFVDSTSNAYLGTVSLSGGSASLSTTSLPEDKGAPVDPPQHNIIAIYFGDSDFVGSDNSATPLPIVEVDVPPTVAITNVLPTDAANAPTAPVGTLLTFGLSLNDSPAECAFSWSVTQGGQPYALPTSVVTNGPTFTFTPTAVGTYVVNLTVGDPDGGSASVQQTVDITSMDANALQSVVNAEANSRNLGGGFSQSQGPLPVVLTIQADPTQISAAVAAVNSVVQPSITDGLGNIPFISVNITLNLTSGDYSDLNFDLQPPFNDPTYGYGTEITLIVNGVNGSTTVVGNSPALTITSGNVIVNNVTFTTATDAPTILVTGGSLVLRNDNVQGSTGFPDAAIAVTGGSVDLGNATEPGGNTLSGSGALITNTSGNPILAAGNTINLSVTTSSSMMRVGNSPPPLTGLVNGTPFTGTTTFTTALGDQITITLSTKATSASLVGQYPITATVSGANADNYVINPATSRTGTMYVVSLGADPSSTTGAEAVTFWDNKGNAKLITAADLSSLDALNLVTQGGAAFDPHSVAQLQSWLSVSPNATVAYQLAVQLAAMDLNVLAGDVKATDLVYAGGLLQYAGTYGISGLTSGGFIDVQDLMNAANAVLGLVSPGAPAHDPNASYEAALTQVLQAANGNSDFVKQDLCWNLISLYLLGQVS
jgi:hypothetical protein